MPVAEGGESFVDEGDHFVDGFVVGEFGGEAVEEVVDALGGGDVGA